MVQKSWKYFVREIYVGSNAVLFLALLANFLLFFFSLGHCRTSRTLTLHLLWVPSREGFGEVLSTFQNSEEKTKATGPSPRTNSGLFCENPCQRIFAVKERWINCSIFGSSGTPHVCNACPPRMRVLWRLRNCTSWACFCFSYEEVFMPTGQDRSFHEWSPIVSPWIIIGLSPSVVINCLVGSMSLLKIWPRVSRHNKLSRLEASDTGCWNCWCPL